MDGLKEENAKLMIFDDKLLPLNTLFKCFLFGHVSFSFSFHLF